jgi:hypothetical protein
VVTFESVRGQTYRFRAATPWTQADFTLHLDSKASGVTGRLAPIASPVAGLRLLQYDGAAAHTTVIESAAILGQWSPMSTNVVAPGDAFVLPEENRTNAFYRLRLVD